MPRRWEVDNHLRLPSVGLQLLLVLFASHFDPVSPLLVFPLEDRLLLLPEDIQRGMHTCCGLRLAAYYAFVSAGLRPLGFRRDRALLARIFRFLLAPSVVRLYKAHGIGLNIDLVVALVALFALFRCVGRRPLGRGS